MLPYAPVSCFPPALFSLHFIGEQISFSFFMKRKNKVSIDALNYLKFAGDHHFATWFWYNSMGRMITKLPHASFETTTQKLLLSTHIYHMKQQHFAHSLLLIPPKHNQLLFSMSRTHSIECSTTSQMTKAIKHVKNRCDAF